MVRAGLSNVHRGLSCVHNFLAGHALEFYLLQQTVAVALNVQPGKYLSPPAQFLHLARSGLATTTKGMHEMTKDCIAMANNHRCDVK
jgi:hypothetical protein